MSKKKKSKHQDESDGKTNETAVMSTAKNRRGLITAAIAMAAIVVVVAIWLGSHTSSATTEVAPSVAGQQTEEASANNQSPAAVTGGPSIHFPEPSFDFGTISQGDKVSHTFVVQNTGDEPLKIIKAKGS